MDEILSKVQIHNSENKKTNRPYVLAALILAIFTSAIEGTIIATAMPSIIGELGGFSLFSWVFSGFLLTQAVTIPIYGKMADLFGRKPVFTFGMIVFLLGSVLCGFAQTMEMLIFFRLIQGIGTGAILPIATTVIGDIYSIDERARVQGYTASVWGISAVIGPALGGLFVQYLNWAWVFWINVPLGILSIVGLWLFLHEQIEKKRHEIDYLGSILLFIFVSAFMVILIQGGVAWSWTSTPVLVLSAVSLLAFSLFLLQETKAQEPIIPLAIWKDRLICISNIAALTTGGVMIGLTTFLPTFVQGAMGKSPTVAGFTLTAMSIGWSVISPVAGRLIFKCGFRKTAIVGSLFLVLGSLFLITLDLQKGPLWAAAGSVLVGIGMGFTSTTFIVAIQENVEWNTRGVATASNMFMRIMGSTLGAAVLAGVLNTHMHSYLEEHLNSLNFPLNLDITNLLLDPQRRDSLSNEVLRLLQEGLVTSLHSVYWAIFLLAIISLLLAVFLPKENKQ